MIHIVDTHALTRYYEDLSLLGAASRAAMTDHESVLVVPTIVFAEARWNIEKKREQVDWDALLDDVDNDPRFIVSPLTLDIVRRIPPGLEMHDGIVVATALVIDEEVSVITRDRQIRDSGLVQTVW